ncbi:MAG: ABC transporter permease [Corynebacterium glucuronolyticum]|nr:ABC transporter permease [Mycobacteriaceae bacterium]MDY5834484.1 ABC transporter permease [Corynebacterium glucuronolyticum]
MGRIVAQLKHDPRTVALVLVIPPLLLTLVYYIFVDVPTPPGHPGMFDRIEPIMLVILPMLMMFIVTSVVMRRERMSGTMERIFTTPLTQLSLVVSYAVVFTILALFQSPILGILLIPVFDVSIEGNLGSLLLVAFLCALFGIAFGLLASAFAENEFQAVQFMPSLLGLSCCCVDCL